MGVLIYAAAGRPVSVCPDPASKDEIFRSVYGARRNITAIAPKAKKGPEAVARGLSNRAVGKELFLSDETVKFHLHKIFRKLAVANRTEAAQTAHRLGLVRSLANAA